MDARNVGLLVIVSLLSCSAPDRVSCDDVCEKVSICAAEAVAKSNGGGVAGLSTKSCVADCLVEQEQRDGKNQDKLMCIQSRVCTEVVSGACNAVPEDDRGCSCRSVGRRSTASWSWLALLIGVAMLRSRARTAGDGVRRVKW